MATGQAVLIGSLGAPEVDRVLDELEALERERSAAHAEQLERVLLLDRALAAEGRALGTSCELALALRCSEVRAGRLLEQAQVLALLPDGLAVLRDGSLTVEQAAAFVSETEVLAAQPATRLRVWERLLSRLRLQGIASAAELRRLVRRWLLQADPAGARARRERAEGEGRVEYRRRYPDDGGVYDLSLLGISAPNAQAALAHIQAGSAPVGPDDERSADRRRLDAAVDLLTGRQVLPLGFAPRGSGSCGHPEDRRCGCGAGAQAPCGAQVSVLVPAGAALGTTDEVAELLGHGPVDAGQLHALLLAAPALRPVWVDEEGTPVAVGDRTWTPRRGDEADLRSCLLGLLDLPVGARQPRHAADHAGATHEGEPGGYRLPRRLRRLLQARRPRCEWPGCGAWAASCDLDHDTAWPDGPTCACNLGPLCRRHHRVKQTGWTKTRDLTGVTWTSPTGRRHRSPTPHEPPRPSGPPAPPARPDLWEQMSPGEREEERWLYDPTDPGFDALDPPPGWRPPDQPPLPTGDALARLLQGGDTTWGLDLQDPYRWLP